MTTRKRLTLQLRKGLCIAASLSMVVGAASAISAVSVIGDARVAEAAAQCPLNNDCVDPSACTGVSSPIAPGYVKSSSGTNIVRVNLRYSTGCQAAWSRIDAYAAGVSNPYPWVVRYTPVAGDTNPLFYFGYPSYAYSLRLVDCCGGYSARAWGSATYGGSYRYGSTPGTY